MRTAAQFDLIVIGAGRRGLELAQAFNRLGTDAIAVDGVDALKLLRRAHKKNVEEDDPEEVAPWNAIDFGAVRSISS